MIQRHNPKTIRRLTGLLVAAALWSALSITAYADYIHGYFRYTVQDNSVTITAYTGTEAVVTVPAMIAGNPVNAISADAFAGNEYVVEVILPDTIDTGTDGSLGSGQGDALSPVQEGTEVPALEKPQGVWDDRGNLLTTDDEGNLIAVNPAGEETVLDSSGGYTRVRGSDGNTAIVNSAGNPVTVSEDTVRYTGETEQELAYNLATGVRTETDRTQDSAVEEVDIDEEPAGEALTVEPAATASPDAAPEESPMEETSDRTLDGKRLPVLLGGSAVLVLLCIARHLRRRRR